MSDINWVRINDTMEMSATPITRRQWVDVMGSDPSYRKSGSEDCPVENVSYHDAIEFCEKLGSGVRLPTGDEWTEACGPDPDDIDEYAWHRGNSNRNTHPVGTKLSNELGLSDMLGNVWEWTSDEDNGCRVLRGGSFLNGTGGCRSAIRYGDDPGSRYVNIGFRVSRTVG